MGVRTFLLIATLAALAACDSVAPQSAEQLYPTRLQPETVTMNAHFTGNADPFTGELAGRFETLVSGYLASGHGPIEVSAVNLPPRDYELVRQKLMAAGVPKGWIRLASAATGNAGDVTLSYQRFDVVAPNCPGWSVAMDRNPENLPDPGLGCDTLHNTAVLAADPADIVSPQPIGPADPALIARVGNNYRNGSVPGTTTDQIQTIRDQTAAGVTTQGLSAGQQQTH